jgi:diguanylate cyclase (GGDEF)-like protein
MEDTAGDTKYYVILIWLVILLSMVSLHLDLFRSVAVPLKRLRWLMAEISADAELGRHKGLSAGLLSERLTPDESRLARRVTDIKELVASFDSMITAVNSHMDERRAAEGRLKRLASTDELTQAFNRSKFEEIIGREMERAARLRLPLSIIIFDIDRFKAVNDSFGHLTGDHVLRTLANIARESIRDTDYLVRWGGEEFLIVSPGTGIDKAVLVAERLRQLMGAHVFEYIGPVTASFGVAEYREGESKDSFILRADAAMYNAKRTRNRVEQAA